VQPPHPAHLGHVAVDLGCGRRPVPGAIGVDAVPLPGVRVVADLRAPHLPFRDESLSHVFALNVLEHLADLPAAMREIARILRAGGRCSVEVPYFAGVSAVADPTHRRAFSYTTFEHFAPAPDTGWQSNRHTWFSDAPFRIVSRRLIFGRAHHLLGLAALANRWPAVYENLFVYWFPARALQVELFKPASRRAAV
jgi:SAM-dependent methyltransferase